MIRRSADSVPTDGRLVMGRLPSSRILLHDSLRPIECYRCILQIIIVIISKRANIRFEKVYPRCRSTILDKCKCTAR